MSEQITVNGNTIYLDGSPVAKVEGDPITAEQVSMLRNVVETPREELMRNLNARLKATT